MNNIEVKIKRWIELIQSEELEAVTKDIQACNITKPDERLNKHIFKLLLYLSRTADKCDKQEHAKGKEIYKLTDLLCSILVEVPDGCKFVSSLFHITRCLLAMYLYKEARSVCGRFKTNLSTSTRHSDASVNDILVKLVYIWHGVTSNLFLSLQKDPSNSVTYSEYKNVVQYTLDMIEIAYANCTKYLLAKLGSYLDKIISVSKKSKVLFTDFCKFITRYLEKTQISLDKDERYMIYRHMLHIASRTMTENIENYARSSAFQVANTLCSRFKKILTTDVECYQCFLHFENTCGTLLKPTEDLTKNSAKAVRDSTENYLLLLKKYGYGGAVKWTAFCIGEMLEPILSYWENCIKTEKKMFLDSGVLIETMTLAIHISTFFQKQEADKCKSCQNAECAVRRDIYNAVVIKTRCVNLVSKLPASDLPQDVCVLARKFLEQNITSIYEMKQCNCKCWTYLWNTCGTLIYNLGITTKSFYEESALLFSLLCTCVIRFEGVRSERRYINLQNPLCSTLHRLSNVHYGESMYREAMTACALNGLLSYDDPSSKAFRMWANIKYKCTTSKKLMELTMLECLRTDKSKIEELGLRLDFSKYDVAQMCVREAKGLQEANVNLSSAIEKVANEITVLKATPVQFARVVQLLSYHSQNYEQEEDISGYLKQAISNLKKTKVESISRLCLEANLEFCSFVNKLAVMNKQTQAEMESTKFALFAPRLSETGEPESRDVVPAYAMINIKQDARLMQYLQQPLKKWNECFKGNINEIVKDWEPALTLEILVTAGEYSRLYRYQECEINAWMLAHKLASELKDDRTLIYVTGRSISARHINRNWIDTAKNLAIKHKDTIDKDIIYAIGIFWISLSDYYFECGLYNDARKLLDNARALPDISFLNNTAVYLYSLDKLLCNCHLYREDMEHEVYTRYLAETLYTMINLNEDLSARKWKRQDKYLFGYDVLFTTSVNITLRMNSLLSFREITAHLMRRLRTAQAIGATIRVAEFLKSLCYIDLSRTQLNDCEVKLQGLEHILNIETFQLSMSTSVGKTQLQNMVTTPTRITDPLRDVPQNDTSPVLRNKVFDLPEFLDHANCNCYACGNTSYHYLILACTHIRAQLYALQKNSAAALQHFQGAFQIKEKIMNISEDRLQKVHLGKEFTWQERYYILDYVLLLVDFAYFLRNDKQVREGKALDTMFLADEICTSFKLEGHPIYMSVQELLFDYRFHRTFDNLDYSAFTVPDPSDIDISKYVQEVKVDKSICSTPITNTVQKTKPLSIRRNRTPPLLKLTKVSMNFSDDEDIVPTPPPVGPRRTRSNSKLVRRKILEDDYSDTSIGQEQESIQSRSKSLIKELVDTSKGNLETIVMRDVIAKIAPLVPDVSGDLYKLVENFNVPATNENMRKLIEMVENLKVNVNSLKRERSIRQTRVSKQSNSSEYNTKINQVIEMFKDITVSEKKSNVELSINDSTLKDSKESAQSVSVNVCTVEKHVTTVEGRTAIARVRTRSTRRVISKETQSMKTTSRKTKEKSL